MGKAERQAAAAARKERYQRKAAEIEDKKNRRLAEIKAKAEAQRQQRARPAAQPSPPPTAASDVPASAGDAELDFKGLFIVRGDQLQLPNGQVRPLRNLVATVHWGPPDPEYTADMTGLFGAVPLLSKRHRFHHWLTIRQITAPVFLLQIDKADKAAAQAFADRFNSLPRTR